MAIDSRYVDLINAEIDGQISAEDQVVLDQHLAENAEARALHEELTLLCGELDAMEEVAPPSDLRQPALDGPGMAGPAARSIKPPIKLGWQTALNEFLGIAAVRYAMSFAFGFIFALTFISSDKISRHAFDDVTGLVGTMSDREAASDTALEDDMWLDLNELAGSVSLDSSESLMILNFDLASQDPVEIVAQFDDRNIWFNGFAQLESAGTSVAAQNGKVTVRMEGQGRYAVYLHYSGRDAATVSLSFFASGQLLHEGDLVLSEKN